jgi:signal transduction histidine kinase
MTIESTELTSDVILPKSRKKTDASLKEERTKTDDSIAEVAAKAESVPSKNAAELEILARERQETDKNLTKERQINDVVVQRVAEKLSEEKDAHEATQAALMTRDEFLAIVSHDLRNPIGTISMVTDALATNSSYAKADAEVRQFIDIIARSADEALRLIEDLLDLERLSAGKLGLQPSSHDINELLQQTITAFEPRAAAKGLKLQLAGSSGPLIAKCDRVRISQVLSNLLGNAVKFTPAGGEVVVSSQVVASEIRISVRDSGPGIPDDLQKKVFERLWQINNKDRRGLGLGLYIAKQLVEAHDGRIWIESEIDKGTTFHVSLPRCTH